jgi:hypothetical protein
MVQITVESIAAFLCAHEHLADVDSNKQQISSAFILEGKQYPLFIRIFGEGNLLQLLTFLPSESGNPLEKIHFADVARLLHLLNKELNLPGFGMDEMAGLIFYRLMIPTPHGEIAKELLLSFLQAIETICQTFNPAIEVVASGKDRIDNILKQIHQ